MSANNWRIVTTLRILSAQDLDQVLRSLRFAADRTVLALGDILANERDSLQVLAKMKFQEIGHHPADDRPLNIVEQVNQTFTYLVTLEAARWLLLQHPGCGGLNINLGTNAGLDLESIEPGFIAAEAFAATHPRSNDKLRKDVARLVEKAPDAEHRYVFFSCPEYPSGRQVKLETVPGIEVWSLPSEGLLKAGL